MEAPDHPTEYERATCIKTWVDDALRGVASKPNVYCASLPVNHVMRDTISTVSKARLAVDYDEPGNNRGRIYCAERHALKPFRTTLSTKFFADSNDRQTRRDLAAVEGMLAGLAGRVAARKLVAPRP